MPGHTSRDQPISACACACGQGTASCDLSPRTFSTSGDKRKSALASSPTTELLCGMRGIRPLPSVWAGRLVDTVTTRAVRFWNTPCATVASTAVSTAVSEGCQEGPQRRAVPMGQGRVWRARYVPWPNGSR